MKHSLAVAASLSVGLLLSSTAVHAAQYRYIYTSQPFVYVENEVSGNNEPLRFSDMTQITVDMDRPMFATGALYAFSTITISAGSYSTVVKHPSRFPTEDGTWTFAIFDIKALNANGLPSEWEFNYFEWNNLSTPEETYFSVYSDSNSGGNMFSSAGVSLGSNYRVFGVGSIGGWELVASPVPEPETIAMFAAGLGLVGWTSRRRSTDAA